MEPSSGPRPNRMRLSEKTLELSICSQFAAQLGRRVVWFGLTQKQEARAGFDACTQWGARVLILQFKASNDLRDGGATRRFYAPHRQMQALRVRARASRRIFYVLPNLGTTQELAKDSDLLSQTWLLDVALIPLLPPPLTRRGTPRKSGEHHLDLTPPLVTVWSEPVELKVVSLESLASDLGGELPGPSADDSPGVMHEQEGQPWPFTRKSLALAIMPDRLPRAERPGDTSR